MKNIHKIILPQEEAKQETLEDVDDTIVPIKKVTIDELLKEYGENLTESEFKILNKKQMKSNEEIEQLAEDYWEGCDGCDANDKYFFIKGFGSAYRQLQENMADKKYTELQLRFFANELIKGVEEKNKQGYEDIKVDYESLILSLNKQD